MRKRFCVLIFSILSSCREEADGTSEAAPRWGEDKIQFCYDLHRRLEGEFNDREIFPPTKVYSLGEIEYVTIVCSKVDKILRDMALREYEAIIKKNDLENIGRSVKIDFTEKAIVFKIE